MLNELNWGSLNQEMESIKNSKNYQIHMLKYLSGAVHLTQDDNHLIIDVFFKLSQVTDHLHFQLCADLTRQG